VHDLWIFIEGAKEAALLINELKSGTPPEQVFKALGFEVNSRLPGGLFRLPRERMEALEGDIRAILAQRRPRVKSLARIAGKIAAATLAFGAAARIYTRHIYRTIEGRRSWWSAGWHEGASGMDSRFGPRKYLAL